VAIIVSFIDLILCILLIVGVLFLTTKSEGFAGITGGSSSQFRGAHSAESQLKQKVTWVAGAYMFFSLLLHVLVS
jgi:protein translocase SecG subunit